MRIRHATPLLLLIALLQPAGKAAAGDASLVIGVQDRRMEIRNTPLFDVSLQETVILGPVDNEQTSLRASYTWHVNPKFTVVAENGWAKSYLELNDTEVSGKTDARLRLLYRPTGNFAIGVGTIVPFGLYELNANEVVASQWMWNPRSGFPVNRFGEGFGWELTAARAFTLGAGTSAGVAAAFLRHAQFELLTEGGTYRLGDEFAFSVALDRALGGERFLRIDSAYTLFGSDELNGAEHIDQGSQFRAGIALDLPFGPFSSTWAVSGARKGDNQLIFNEAAADEDSTLSLSEAPGRYLYFDGRIGTSPARSFYAYLAGRIASSSDSEYAIGANGRVYQFGPGFGWRPNRAVAFSMQYGHISGTGDDDVEFDGRDILFTMEIRR